MTMNGSIAAALFAIASGSISLGVVFIWQTRGRWLRWPSPALLAIGGPFVGLGIVFAQIVLFRLYDLPFPFGTNDPGTLLLRCIVAVLLWALVVRVHTGRLLTPADRARIREGPTP